ncbi:MAG: large conductance mechanosensitive channel [Thermoplasmata archaeon]|jgi:large conductance mechanosensitive channel|nr:large conductance mechanosensitive channel [Thermoplasmata archaeon]
MRILGEFREFAVKGSVMDLAVGVIIGAAFGKIVASLVADLLMPPISMLLGGIDFSNRFWVLRGGSYPTLEEAQAAGAVTLNYGRFVNAVLEFLIVAFAVFLLVRQLNRMRRKGAPPAPDTRPCPECLSTIPKRATRCAHCAVAVT